MLPTGSAEARKVLRLNKHKSVNDSLQPHPFFNSNFFHIPQKLDDSNN